LKSIASIDSPCMNALILYHPLVPLVLTFLAAPYFPPQRSHGRKLVRVIFPILHPRASPPVHPASPIGQAFATKAIAECIRTARGTRPAGYAAACGLDRARGRRRKGPLVLGERRYGLCYRLVTDPAMEAWYNPSIA